MRSFFALAIVALTLGVIGCEVAADEQATDAADTLVDDVPAADPEAAESEIPDGDAAALLAFIEETVNAEAVGETDDEQLADATRRLQLIVEASARAIERDPTAEQLVEAHRIHLQALDTLKQLGVPDVEEQLAEAIEAAMASPSPEVAMQGWQSFLFGQILQWRALDDDAKDPVAQRILDEVTDGEPERFDVVLLYMLASNLDSIDDAFIEKVLTEALPTLQESESTEVQEALAEANLEGKLRRYKLPGQPMEVFGELLGGGEVDWESYRGKVVLVDFSATWCPPCIEEAPNVVDMYQKYHDKGFDVIAVSLDRTPEAAERYIEDNDIQWATLFPSKTEERYWNHPLVQHYGIGGIPTAILVDQEGRVVDMDARGSRLRELLVQFLGEPSEPAEPAAEEPAETAEAPVEAEEQPAEATEASGG
jgi:thiol-disulfide isomerase/thioredoxin